MPAHRIEVSICEKHDVKRRREKSGTWRCQACKTEAMRDRRRARAAKHVKPDTPEQAKARAKELDALKAHAEQTAAEIRADKRKAGELINQALKPRERVRVPIEARIFERYLGGKL